MEDDRSEWDDAKAAGNTRKHDVSFEDACKVFDDPNAIDNSDLRDDYGEDRSTIVGIVIDVVLSVAYTERDGKFRLISARKANRREQDDYYSQ